MNANKSETEVNKTELTQVCEPVSVYLEKRVRRLKRSRRRELLRQVFRSLTSAAKVWSTSATSYVVGAAAAQAHAGMKGLKCGGWRKWL